MGFYLQPRSQSSFKNFSPSSYREKVRWGQGWFYLVAISPHSLPSRISVPLSSFLHPLPFIFVWRIIYWRRIPTPFIPKSNCLFNFAKFLTLNPKSQASNYLDPLPFLGYLVPKNTKIQEQPFPGVLWHRCFEKFRKNTWGHLCRSLFLDGVAVQTTTFKRSSDTGIFLWI